MSYPILDTGLMPDRIDIALINRPDLPASGAGEAAIRPVAAAIANAIFDATGTRLRRAPFTPSRVKAALGMTAAKPARASVPGMKGSQATQRQRPGERCIHGGKRRDD